MKSLEAKRTKLAQKLGVENGLWRESMRQKNV